MYLWISIFLQLGIYENLENQFKVPNICKDARSCYNSNLLTFVFLCFKDHKFVLLFDFTSI